MDQYRNFIALSRYARWLEDEGRRETWPETVRRYIKFWQDKGLIDDITAESLYKAKVNHEVMGSMRATMTAGEALDRDNVAGFNCSYSIMDGCGKSIEIGHPELDEPVQINIQDPVCFDEVMYILMCGTGLGFSAERQYTNNLPKVGKKLNRRRYLANNKNYPGVDKNEISVFDRKTNTIHVQDSKYGWSSAFRILLFELYNGNFDVEWDVSSVRPAGAKLNTFGGRASGPEPLVDLFNFCKEVFKKAEGRKLNSLEVHDIVCKIADIVVVGGVRRSALISLSNPSDERIKKCKTGNWFKYEPQRALANNSACYTEKPDFESFLNEWQSLYESKSGERGMFSRVASQKKAAENGRRDSTKDFGTNPCSEIILRPFQFCNLSEVVIRPDDTLESLKDKVKKATIFGTLQATLTDFKYLRPIWADNTKEEALLGVSLTGIMDHPVMNGLGSEEELKEWLAELKQVAIDTNKEWADRLGINQSTAITCVKPSGTVSQLVDSASGIHPRFNKYYIRTVRADSKDPLAQFMIDRGFPYEDCMFKGEGVKIFSFPMQCPDESVTVKILGAMEQLRIWKIYQDYWCEHKPSITVYYKDSEFLKIGAWLYDNFDQVSGISFLPYDDHTYPQAPYQEIDEAKYHELLGQMPKNVDWENLGEFEKEDHTSGNKELACSAGVCEVVDLTK